MNIEEIRALAEIIDTFRLTEIEIGAGESRVRLVREEKAVQAASMPQAASLAQPILPPQAAPYVPVLPQADLDMPSAVDFNDITEVKSPMVGVFYEAPAPDAEPFVRRGSRVKKGDVLCIIEAMKLLNEITAETDGEIADVCVRNGEVVEFSQTLFKIY